MVLIIDSVVKPTYNELVASPCVYTYVYTLCVKVILYLYVYFKRLYWSPSNKQWKIRLSPTGCQIRISILGFDNPWPNKKYKCVCVSVYMFIPNNIYVCAKNPEKIQKSFATHGIGFAFYIFLVCILYILCKY